MPSGVVVLFFIRRLTKCQLDEKIQAGSSPNQYFFMNQSEVKIAWFGKHFGEEPPLTGHQAQGAGTIFFSHCHLHCVFCQNFQISQQGQGRFYQTEQLAKIMLDLQDSDAVNIDLVSPTLWWQPLKQAIISAKRRGLTVPIVWNSNAYESLDLLREFTGLIDIYLPDFKYGDANVGLKYSGIKNYPETALGAIGEMFKQVGYLQVDRGGLATKGLIVRHLVLPNKLENSFKALECLAGFLKNIHISLMNQYTPLYRAAEFAEINRSLSAKEYEQVVDYFYELGLVNGWVQAEMNGPDLVPDFKKKQPFAK